jgi:heat shock protein HslJ
MNDRPRPILRLVAAAVLVAVVGACTSIGPGPSPSGPSPSSPGPSASPAPPSAGTSEGDGQLGNLAGTGWRVLRIDDLVPVAGSEPTIAFKDGQMQGTTGCNSYGGPVTIRGSSFEAGGLMMTLIGCMDEIAEMETAFLQAINGATELAAEGANLVIRGPGGEIVLRPDATVAG